MSQGPSRVPPVRCRQQDGAVMVEFAGVFIAFMILLWAVITYGMVFAVNHSLSSAAAEGARAAISAPAGTEASVASSVATDRLAWMGSSASSATISSTVNACVGIPQDCITVRITYPYGSNPIVPGLGLVPIPDTLSSQSTVSL